MIVYGADEAFKWQHRVAQFTGAVRCAPGAASATHPLPEAHVLFTPLLCRQTEHMSNVWAFADWA